MYKQYQHIIILSNFPHFNGFYYFGLSSKKLIKHVQCRLKLLKSKRESIIKQSRQVIVQLIKNGEDYKAFSRVEQLIRDESVKEVYELLDNFSELIIIRLRYIRRHRDCPDDINEAVSSLLYASARFGDLPELIKLRKLFGNRYGNKFVTNAVELFSGNHVNQQMIDKFNMKSVSGDIKFRILREIARENNLTLSPPDIGRGLDTSAKSVSDDNFDGDITVVKPVDDDIVLLSENKSLVRVEREEKSDCSSEIYGFKSSGQGSPKNCMLRKASYTTSMLQKMEKIWAKWDGGSKLFRQSSVFADDVQEFEPCKMEDSKGVDQRVFIFKLSMPSLRCNSKDGFLSKNVNRKSTSSRCAKKRKKSATTTLRNRFVPLEKPFPKSQLLLTSSSAFMRQEEVDEVNDVSEGAVSIASSASSTAIVPWTESNLESSSLNCLALVPSNSSSWCSHTHPKLPDYDELVTKFMALKIEHMQKCSSEVSNG
ncbi:hypothetical protein ACHQM5_003050 [Ranunculus cassubicifolius]